MNLRSLPDASAVLLSRPGAPLAIPLLKRARGEPMRDTATRCLLALLLNSTIVAAQNTAISKDTKVKSDNGKVVTMIGCVEIGGGTSFELTNITSERERHDTTALPRGGSYALTAREGLDLGLYIQQKVELTGVVVPAATSRDKDDKIKIKETSRVDVKNGPDKTSSTATSVKVARGAVAHFLVASVKTLAPSCLP
jgi:hypothetical protein